ncbi:MAG TPA: hypothetical protein VG963_29165 [Polyangiaceae bacterium]|nr:hypothetical protein [Polyangiaceae bacterium]
MPAVCRNTELHVPLRYAPLFWGWPQRFLARMDAVNTRILIVAGTGTMPDPGRGAAASSGPDRE